VQTPQAKKVTVIPCSGIGKAFGSVSRDAAFQVVENLQNDKTDTVCLALIVSGDNDAQELVRGSKCITIDGCPMECAEKNVRLAGGNIVHRFRVVDAFKKNRHLKPKSVTSLDNDGKQLASLLAIEVSRRIDELLEEP
jgi:uncharacterized metal-binding protein